MSEAVDMADSGQETPETVPWRAARRAREARVKYWRAFAVSSFFIVVLSASLYSGAAFIFGSFRSHDGSDRIWSPAQTARITRPLLDGTFCRTIIYDNNSARTIEDKVVRCNTGGRDIKGMSTSKSAAEFNWGGK